MPLAIENAPVAKAAGGGIKRGEGCRRRAARVDVGAEGKISRGDADRAIDRLKLREVVHELGMSSACHRPPE